MDEYRRLGTFVEMYGSTALTAKGEGKTKLEWYENFKLTLPQKLAEQLALKKKIKADDLIEADLLDRCTKAQQGVRRYTKELTIAKKPVALISTHLKGKSMSALERSPGKIDTLLLKCFKMYQVKRIN